jgi:hypothetical protein
MSLLVVVPTSRYSIPRVINEHLLLNAFQGLKNSIHSTTNIMPRFTMPPKDEVIDDSEPEREEQRRKAKVKRKDLIKATLSEQRAPSRLTSPRLHVSTQKREVIVISGMLLAAPVTQNSNTPMLQTIATDRWIFIGQRHSSIFRELSRIQPRTLMLDLGREI